MPNLPEPYYDADGITIYHSDCRKILSRLPKVDLVLTDPPYGACRSGGVGKYGREKFCGSNDLGWDTEAPSLETLLEIVDRAERSIFWGGNYYGLPATRMFLVWDKGASFRGRDFAEAELAWCSWDGNSRVFQRDPLASQDYIGKQHPTMKPLALMNWCLSLYPEARTVLDPYMGSGTTLVAAKHNGLRAIGIEREEKYCAIAVDRLRQQSLFTDELAVSLNTEQAQMMLGARDLIAGEAFELFPDRAMSRL